MLKIKTVDLAVSTILLAIGIAEFIGGFTMDRLEVRQIHPASIPGLLPMVLGLAIAIVAALQLIGLYRRGDAEIEGVAGGLVTVKELARLALLIAICAFYALFLVGRVHFWVASSLFITGFMLIFELSLRMTKRKLAITITRAVVIAVVFGGAVSFLFEDLFLVRLP